MTSKPCSDSRSILYVLWTQCKRRRLALSLYRPRVSMMERLGILRHRLPRSTHWPMTLCLTRIRFLSLWLNHKQPDNRDKKKTIDGDEIEKGLKDDMFSSDMFKEKGVRATIFTADDGDDKGKVTKIRVVAGKKKAAN